ncbi:MAG: hypothetical protein IKK53_00020 [Ruminiclostridium sp.]|nr:hypothetical protein [Ruminiclostridium sp.]
MGLFDKFKNKRSDDNLNIEIPVNVKLIGLIDECTNNSIYVPQTKHTYEIKIPNNIEKGYRMRLKGCGLSSPKGYAGDLVLIITNIECNDITINKSILFTEIDKDILINIPHLNRNINVTIPSSLKSKDVFTLRLKGLGLSNDYGEIGNLFIKTSVIKSKEEYDACCEYPELNSLIGLTNIKKEVSNMANLINMQTQRAAQGLKSVPISRHCVFTGNPGTGKTTFARIMADIYKNMGVLSKGQLIYLILPLSMI